MLKQRIASFFIALVSVVILYWTWHEFNTNGAYYLKAAAFAPLGIVGGIFLIFFPEFYGKPETTKEKVVVFAVCLVGILAGLFNWYLIDPQRFNF